MEKIKQFVKENKEIVIGSIIGAGLAVGGKVIYDIGVTKGVRCTNTIWLSMLNADTDRTLMLRDCIMTKAKLDEDTMKDFVKFGHETLEYMEKGLA